MTDDPELDRLKARRDADNMTLAEKSFRMALAGVTVIGALGSLSVTKKLELIHTLELEIMRVRHNVMLAAIRTAPTPDA